MKKRSIVALVVLLSLSSFLALRVIAAEARPAVPPAEPGAPPRASVRLVSPRAADVAYGPVVIRAEVMQPVGIRALRVDFFADGVLIGSDPLPPYEASWDAGKGMGSHVFRAVARFADGTSAEDLITTRGLSYTQHELVQGTAIDRVQLLVSVTDPNGAPPLALSAQNLEVREGETPVMVKTFKKVGDSPDIPLSVAVLVDRSGSMMFQMKKWAAACVELVASVRPIDQVRVAAFSDQIEVLQDFTHDAASLARSVASIGSGGGNTLLFRAIFVTLRDMRDLPGRKALILLTDGLDTEFTSASGAITVGMFPILADATRMAVRSGVTVILILPGPSGRGYLAVQDFALQTGGWYMYPSDDLRGLLKRLGQRLLSSYVVEYDIERPADIDRKRPVKVTLKGEGTEGLEVHTSLGVYSRPSTLDELKKDLRDGNRAQRARAATELGRTGDAEVVPDLIRALKADFPEVRAAAAAALAERKAPEGMEKVLKLIHDANAAVREAAFEAAVRYGTAAVPRLQELAAGGGPARPGALRALGDIADPNSLPTLIAGLRERNCELRVAATDGLGWFYAIEGSGLPTKRSIEVERKRTLDPLRKLLSDPCPAASEAATVALGRLVDPEALPNLLAATAEAPLPRRIDEIVRMLAYYPTKESLAAVERFLTGNEPTRTAARIAAASLYAVSGSTGKPLDRDEAVRRLISLGGEEALQSIKLLLAQADHGSPEPEWKAKLDGAVKTVTGE